VDLAVGPIRLRLPATSANLGAAFDCAAVALALHLTIEAVEAETYSITATGEDAELCARLKDNLILETYKSLLAREGKAAVPLAIRMDNRIPLGMGCGSSAAGRLAAIALAAHFGELGWDSERILAEACALEGHPDNAAACWLGGLVVAAMEGDRVRAAWVEPPAEWRAMVVLPGESLATSKARAVLPEMYSRADAVANIQAAALLGLAFAQERGDLLRTAMQDRLHQPYRAEMCAQLPPLLPLAGRSGILGVALSGAGPSVLLILEGIAAAQDAAEAVRAAIGEDETGRILTVAFAADGAARLWGEMQSALRVSALGESAG
jgi:homoserine kinase